MPYRDSLRFSGLAELGGLRRHQGSRDLRGTGPKGGNGWILVPTPRVVHRSLVTALMLAGLVPGFTSAAGAVRHAGAAVAPMPVVLPVAPSAAAGSGMPASVVQIGNVPDPRSALAAAMDGLGRMIVVQATEARSLVLPGLFGAGELSRGAQDSPPDAVAAASGEAPAARAPLPDAPPAATPEEDRRRAVADAEQVNPAAGRIRGDQTPEVEAADSGSAPAETVAPGEPAASGEGVEPRVRATRAVTPLDGIAPPNRGPAGTLGDADLARRAAEERSRLAAAQYAAAAEVGATGPDGAGPSGAPERHCGGCRARCRRGGGPMPPDTARLWAMGGSRSCGRWPISVLPRG